MWLFTTFGFFSVVCARTKDGKGKPNPAMMMIRARDAKHLENLINACPFLDADTNLVGTPDGDYPFRVFVPRGTFVRILEWLGEEIMHSNVKQAAEEELPNDRAYTDTLHRVWAVCRAIEGLR